MCCIINPFRIVVLQYFVTVNMVMISILDRFCTSVSVDLHELVLYKIVRVCDFTFKCSKSILFVHCWVLRHKVTFSDGFSFMCLLNFYLFSDVCVNN